MSKKSKPSLASFKWNGIKQIKVAKLLAVFVLGHLLLWAIFSSPEEGPPPPTLQAQWKHSLFVSLPIKLLGPLKSSGATRMSLKHESRDLLIPEVLIHQMQWETPHSGMAKIEMHPNDLKSIIQLGEYQQFVAFPWNSHLLTGPKTKTQTKEDSYEIHLDHPSLPCAHPHSYSEHGSLPTPDGPTPDSHHF